MTFTDPIAEPSAESVAEAFTEVFTESTAEAVAGPIAELVFVVHGFCSSRFLVVFGAGFQ